MCVRARVEDEMGRGEVGVSMRAPSGFLLSSLCVTLARDGSLSTVLPVPLNITHTHTRTEAKTNKQRLADTGYEHLQYDLRLGREECVCVCVWEREQTTSVTSHP